EKVILSDPDKKESDGKKYIFPDQAISYPIVSIDKENAIKELPYARFIPGDTLYPLIQLKERLSFLNKTDEEAFLAKIEFASKRLVEIDGLLTKGRFELVEPTLDDYQNIMNSVRSDIESRVRSLSGGNLTQELERLDTIILRQREALASHI